jgi:hypothetical protein
MAGTGKQNTRTQGTTTPHRNTASPPQRIDGRDVGTALRMAYQTTVEESIPDAMLDLLGKLK